MLLFFNSFFMAALMDFHGGIRDGCIVAVIYNARRPKAFSSILGVVNMILLLL